MVKTDIAALLALGAALFLAIGDVVQQRSVHDVADESLGHLAVFVRLLRSRRWWAGSSSAAVGFGMQVTALGLGSVLLVQALLVCSLLFALPIGAAAAHHRVTRWQWVWAVLLAVSVAVIVTVGDPQVGQSRASWARWVWVVVVIAPMLAACVVGARRRPGPTGAALFGVVSGALWGVFAVLIKGVVDALGHGAWGPLGAPELYCSVTAAVAAIGCQQASFRAGSLAASLPATTVAEPLVSAVLGVVVLGETLAVGDAGRIVLVVVAAVMVVATAVLARSEAGDAADVAGTDDADDERRRLNGDRGRCDAGEAAR